METLRLDNVCKIYKSKSRKEEDVVAVSNFNLVVEDNEFIVFVGPSGCGKSTTLRMIAGLEDITSGNLYIDGELVNKIEPNYRNIAMVFQNYALYPHMSAYNNMAFGLKNRHVPKDEIDRRIHEAAKILDIEDLLKRKPKAMSGGQRQRVALGRSIVRTPKIFLLDEPLSNLDAKLRSQMRVEINKLYEKLKTTFVYVTHDQVEAMTMGTRIVVMRKGVVQQIDTPTTLYDYPINRFVAGFLGTPQMNFYECEIQKVEENLHINMHGNKFIFKLSELREIDANYLDGNIHSAIIGIRPDDIHIKKSETSIEAKVNIIEVLGNETLLYANFNANEDASISESPTSVVISVQGRPEVKMNDVIEVNFNPSKIHLFKNEEGDESSIMLTPRTKRNEIRAYLEVKDNKAYFKITPSYSFSLDLDINKINPVYLKGLHRVTIKFNDALKVSKNGTLNVKYFGKGLLENKNISRFELNRDYSYDISFMHNDSHLYLETDANLNINDEVKLSVDLEKVEILGDDHLSIFDLNVKEKEVDEFAIVKQEDEVKETKSILKIFNKNKENSTNKEEKEPKNKKECPLKKIKDKFKKKKAE